MSAVTLTQTLSQTILPTLNVNVNNVDTAASTTVGTNGTVGTVETVTLADGSNVNLTSGNQYVSTTTAPPTDSAIAIELPVVPTTSPSTPPIATTPSTTTINGVTITDNGDGTYAYSLPTATGGVETVAGNGNGAAVVNIYTSGGALAGSETTGFDANACRRYKVRSCLRTNQLGCRPKTYLKTAKSCAKPTSAEAKKLKIAQTLVDLGIKRGSRPMDMCASSY